MKDQIFDIIQNAGVPVTAKALSEKLEAPLEEVQAALDALALDYRQLAIAAALGVGCFVWIRGLRRRFSPIALIAASALLGVLFYSA